MEKKKYKKVIKSDDNINTIILVIFVGTLLIEYFFIAMFSVLVATDGEVGIYFAVMLSPIILSVILTLLYYSCKVEIYYEEV